MKYAIAAVVITAALAGCSTQFKPADNIITPIPETSASLVPGPNHTWEPGDEVGVGGEVGSQSNSGVGGSVGLEGK